MVAAATDCCKGFSTRGRRSWDRCSRPSAWWLPTSLMLDFSHPREYARRGASPRVADGTLDVTAVRARHHRSAPRGRARPRRAKFDAAHLSQPSRLPDGCAASPTIHGAPPGIRGRRRRRDRRRAALRAVAIDGSGDGRCRQSRFGFPVRRPRPTSRRPRGPADRRSPTGAPDRRGRSGRPTAHRGHTAAPTSDPPPSPTPARDEVTRATRGTPAAGRRPSARGRGCGRRRRHPILHQYSIRPAGSRDTWPSQRARGLQLGRGHKYTGDVGHDRSR